ncbi:hypothetical protein [Actinobacillus vicugnae]|uniref:hypothetical protein n=1 Tax=Actinobacillus vicugnae TaxID=2573093 RepID=UPI00123F29A4|nr:hypothetical protein [Actinobacillus vicugnae]
MISLLSQAFLAKNDYVKSIYDPRLVWNTEEFVKEAGGEPLARLDLETKDDKQLMQEKLMKFLCYFVNNW